MKRPARSWRYTYPVHRGGEPAKTSMRGHPHRTGALANELRHVVRGQARHHPQHDDLSLIGGQRR
jgi:hypothetical protein